MAGTVQNGTPSVSDTTPPRLLIDFRKRKFVLELETSALPSIPGVSGRMRLSCQSARTQALLVATALVLKKHCDNNNFEPVSLLNRKTYVELLPRLYEELGEPRPGDMFSSIAAGWKGHERGFANKVDFSVNGIQRSMPHEVQQLMKKLLVLERVEKKAPVLRLNQDAVKLTPSDIKVEGYEELLKRLRSSTPSGPLEPRRRHYVFPDSTIQAFRNYYLGTAKDPMIFGGRESELSSLDDWLNRPATCPYLFLTSPAGRGKSALLVRWTESLKGCNSVETIFYPISTRYETNRAQDLFQCLVERLARFYGEPAGSGDLSSNRLRDQVLSLLSRPAPGGKRLLVVIDGLDESSGSLVRPNLFPVDPPRGLKVLVSARHHATASTEDWLSQLGWKVGEVCRVMQLGSLNYEAVLEVISHSGFALPSTKERSHAAAALMRLSGGEPFLLGLHLDDMRAKIGQQKGKRVSVQAVLAALQQIPPGLAGYLEHWHKDQQRLMGTAYDEQSTQALLQILACARAPLGLDDLQQLVAAHEPPFAEKLTQAIRVVSRFLLYDAKHRTYVFCHPVLRDYFCDRLALSVPDLARVGQAYATAGAQLLSSLERGTIPPEHASRYFVRYLGAHLEDRVAPPETMRQLTADVWRRSWHALEHNHRGFLNDVHRAWRTAEEENSKLLDRGDGTLPHLGLEIRCALLEACLARGGGNVSPELFRTLLQEELLDPWEAKMYIDATEDPGRRACLLLTYATFVRSFPAEQKRDMLREAQQVAQQLADAAEKHRLLLRIAERQAEAEDVDQALISARLIQDSAAQAEALARIAGRARSATTALNLLSRAEALTREASRTGSPGSNRAAAILSRQWARRGKRQKAWSCVRLMSPSPNPEELKLWLAGQRSVLPSRSTRTVLSDPHIVPHELLFAAPPFRELAEEYFSEHGGRFDKAIVSLRACLNQGSFSGDKEGIERLESLVLRLRSSASAKPNPALLNDARDQARNLGDPLRRITALAAVSAALSEGNEKDDLVAEGTAIVRAIDADSEIRAEVPVFRLPGRADSLKVTALIRLANPLRQGDQRKRLLQEALSAALNTPDQDLQVWAISSLSWAAAANGYRTQADQMIRGFPVGPRQGELAAYLIRCCHKDPERRALLLQGLSTLQPWIDRAPATVYEALKTMLNTDAATVCANELLATILAVPEHTQREDLLVRLAPFARTSALRTQLFEAILNTREETAFASRDLSAACLGYLAAESYEHGDTQLAVRILDFIPRGRERARAMIAMAQDNPDRELALEYLCEAVEVICESSEAFCDDGYEESLAILVGLLVAAHHAPLAVRCVHACIPHLKLQHSSVWDALKQAAPESKLELLRGIPPTIATDSILRQPLAQHVLGHLHTLCSNGHLDAALDCAADLIAVREYPVWTFPEARGAALFRLACLLANEGRGAVTERLNELARMFAGGHIFYFEDDYLQTFRSVGFPNRLFTRSHVIMAAYASAGMVDDVEKALDCQESVERLMGAYLTIQDGVPEPLLHNVIHQRLAQCDVLLGTPGSCARDLLEFAERLSDPTDRERVLMKAFALATTIAKTGEVQSRAMLCPIQDAESSPVLHTLQKIAAMPHASMSGLPGLTVAALTDYANSYRALKDVLRNSAELGQARALYEIGWFSDVVFRWGGIAALEEAAATVNEVT